MPQVRVLTAADFNDVIAEGTVFVKFFAPWLVTMLQYCMIPKLCYCRCGHCKRLAPTWDQLAEVTHSKTGITIAKVPG